MILADGAPSNLVLRRQLRESVEESSQFLIMEPKRFSSNWLEYDLYTRWYIKGVVLSLGIPAGMTATLSYGDFSAVLTGKATRPIELPYGGTPVLVTLSDPEYSGKDSVYVLHVHREMHPDARTLPTLFANAIGGNASISFEVARESTFNELALEMGSESTAQQPASHYTLTVINPGQLARGEDLTVLYTFDPRPDWADRLTVVWEPTAAAESLSGADVIVFEPPSGNATVVYAANATTRLLLHANGTTYSYAVRVDMGSRLESIANGLGDGGSNQDGTGGLGGLDDDTDFIAQNGTGGLGGLDDDTKTVNEDTPRPWWLIPLLIGGAALLFMGACCTLLARAWRNRRRRERQQERAEAYRADADTPMQQRRESVWSDQRDSVSSLRSDSAATPILGGVPFVGSQHRLSMANPLVSEGFPEIDDSGDAGPRPRERRPSLLNSDSEVDTWFGMAMENNPMAEFSSDSRRSTSQAGNPLWAPNDADEEFSGMLASAGGIVNRDTSKGLSERWMGENFVETGGSLMMGSAGEAETYRWTDNDALATAGGDMQIEDLSTQGMAQMMVGGAMRERTQTVVNPLFAAAGENLDSPAGPISAPWGGSNRSGTLWEKNPAQRSSAADQAHAVFQHHTPRGGLGRLGGADSATGWSEHVGNDGSAFWINFLSGESTHSLPHDLASSRLSRVRAAAVDLRTAAGGLQEDSLRQAVDEVAHALEPVDAVLQDDAEKATAGDGSTSGWEARRELGAKAIEQADLVLNELSTRSDTRGAEKLEEVLLNLKGQLATLASVGSGVASPLQRRRRGSTWNDATGMMESENPLYRG